MLAYHNDPQLKQQILEQLQGSGWNVFIEDYKNGLGIPKTLIYLHDAISRGLPSVKTKQWPIRFISAIQVGADLSTIWRDFALWLLVDPADGVIQYTTPGTEVYEAILRVANLYQDGYTQQQMIEAAYNVAAAADAYAAYNVAAAAYATYAVSAAAAAHAHASNAALATATARNAAYIKISNKLIELLEKQEAKHDHK